MWDVHTWDFAGHHGRMFSAIVLLLCFPYLECVTVFYRGKGQWVERFENRGPRTMAESVFKLQDVVYGKLFNHRIWF